MRVAYLLDQAPHLAQFATTPYVDESLLFQIHGMCSDVPIIATYFQTQLFQREFEALDEVGRIKMLDSLATSLPFAAHQWNDTNLYLSQRPEVAKSALVMRYVTQK